MSTRTIITGLGTVLIAGGLIWVLGFSRSPAQSGPEPPKHTAPPKEKAARTLPLLAQAPNRQAPARQPLRDPNKPLGDFVEEAPVIPNCHLSVDEKTEVSTQREGVLLYVGRPIEPGEQVPPGHLDTYFFGNKKHQYRRLKQGDIVEVNEVLGRIDDRLALDELETKKNKLIAAKADLVVSEKTLAEARERLKTQADLLKTRATSLEEYRGAQLAVDKYIGEVASKKAAIKVAEAELQQTATVVGLHEIRSKIRGQVQTIYKRKGEEVKNLEPILLLRNLDTMRAEGRIDIQLRQRLSKGMKVWVEPSQDQPHHAPFFGHLEPITGVAVASDSRTIVSVSDDRTARVWERGGEHERRILKHDSGLRSVACTPIGAVANYCATGGADGSIRLYDLADLDKEYVNFQGKHRGPVTCIAFNKDGTVCATGGDDHEIRIWDVPTGQLKFKLTDHHGQITSLQFTPQNQLVSAARDNTLMLWNMSAGPPVQIFRRRSGSVTVLGVSPDGKRVLYDPAESKALRVLSLPEGLHEGIIRNTSGPSSFSTLALFSPDGRFILAGEGSEGRLELWTAPNENSRASEIRKLAMDDPSTVTCAAFAPDASFVVAGTKDRQVLAWGPLPSEKDVADFRVPAVISNIDRAVDAGTRPQVRVVAEFENPKGPDGVGKLLHGGTVNLVIPPEK
jgi:WD40 repeat protein